MMLIRYPKHWDVRCHRQPTTRAGMRHMLQIKAVSSSVMPGDCAQGHQTVCPGSLPGWAIFDPAHNLSTVAAPEMSQQTL